jgi:hypothetical protein
MIKTIAILLMSVICQVTLAQGVVEVGRAKYRFEDRRFADVFKRSLVIGHSISSGLMHRIDSNYGKSPGNVLAEDYAQVPVMANIAEGVGTLETGLSKMNRWLLNEQDRDAKPGADRDIETMNSRFDHSSVIVGVDALYMAASFNECADYGDQGVAGILEQFAQKASAAGKVLILGNVPKEERSTFSSLAKMVLPEMNESCRQVINTSLKQSCTTNRNCYIVDLESLVNTLNTTGQLVLKDGTVLKDDPSFFGRLKGRQVRPDGVNMSDQGVQVIVEEILSKLATNPPRLNAPAPAIMPR